MRRLNGIEPFVAVAETGSFTKAAERLQTAKSSVSDSVRQLEDRLGVRLVERTTRHLRLTDAGSAFLLRCRRLLDDLEMARTEVRAFNSSAEGHLRVAVPETFNDALIIPCLPELVERYPKLSIELIGESRVSRLVEEEFDLAIRIFRDPPETWIVKRIASQRILVVGSPAYLEQHGTPETVADLKRHFLVGTTRPILWPAKWLVDSQEVQVAPRVVVNTVRALRTAALEGLGLVRVPDWLVLDALATGALTEVLPTGDSERKGIFAVYPTNRHLTSLVRVFVDHVERHLRSVGVPLR